MEQENDHGMLERLLEPLSRSLNASSAKAIVELKTDPEASARIEKLAEKCNEGELSDQERREYETYVHACNLISILQAKARLFLKEHP